ncbi:MAG: ABC transporter ATP-binding protein [Anaerolineae bacterium]|nr:ABC transporter ATP-binding protein [Anaerolineae bacterium]
MFGGGPHHAMARETSKPRNVGATLVRLASYFRDYRPALVVVAAMIIVGTWAQVQAPVLIGQAVDCYLAPAVSGNLGDGATREATSGCTYTNVDRSATAEELISGFGGIILLITGLYVLGALTGALQFYLMRWSGVRVLKTLRVELFQHLNRLSLGYYSQHEAGDLMSRITNDMETIQQAVSFALVSVTSGALLLVWITYNMLRLSAPYALLSMTVIPLMVVVTLWFSGQARKAFRRTRVEIGRVNADLQETISGVREVQAFGREEVNFEQFREANAANRDANIRAVSFTAALSPSLEALGYVAVAIVAVVGGLAVMRGQPLFGTAVSLGLIITFINYVQRFNQPIQQIATLWANIQSAIAGAERIFGLMDEPVAITDRPGAQPMPDIVGEVEFDRVSAAYVEGEMVLKEVSFCAEPGQTVAIVGPTGAGKTTILNLIPRFYDVVGGAVRIDGIDVRDVQVASLRRQIGMVLQDTFLFSDTVMENIRFGRLEASDEEVIAAAKLARAHDFIERLPQGYQTVLGERGTGLSQGQRQLLAIARAALADPRILILDEATSSVDTRTERLIQKALEELLRGRTSFVVAHRLSTIRNADQVLVLVEGRIVERGTHSELLARRGAYYDLYMSQFIREETEAVAK